MLMVMLATTRELWRPALCLDRNLLSRLVGAIEQRGRNGETESALLAKMIGMVAVARLAARAEWTKLGFRFKHG
jgi:hypothetical protein